MRSSHDRKYAAWIECPACESAIAVSASASVLESTRCESCGLLVPFDEMIALRAAEHARTNRYQ